MKFFVLPRISFDWKVVFVTIASTLLLMVDHYNMITNWKPWDRTILYLAIPWLSILLVFRENPREYGFQLGNWRAGLVITAISLIIILPLLWVLVQHSPSMRLYYLPLMGPSLPIYTFFDLLGWEFMFRGWLTFAYTRKFGPDGLWLQAVPFALAHIGKPEVETLTTILGGFLFGIVAWRTKSFIYPFLIHWAIFTFVVFAASGVVR